MCFRPLPLQVNTQSLANQLNSGAGSKLSFSSVNCVYPHCREQNVECRLSCHTMFYIVLHHRDAAIGLPQPTLSISFASCHLDHHVQASKPALPCPALPCPALPCPALPCPILLQPCHVRSVCITCEASTELSQLMYVLLYCRQRDVCGQLQLPGSHHHLKQHFHGSLPSFCTGEGSVVPYLDLSYPVANALFLPRAKCVDAWCCCHTGGSISDEVSLSRPVHRYCIVRRTSS